MAFDWAGKDTKSRFNNRARDPRMDEMLRFHTWGANKKTAGESVIRLVGPAFMFAEHWFDFKTKAGKVSPMRKRCKAFNPESGEFDLGPCPYCKMTGETGKVQLIANAIIRSAERMRPATLPPVPAEEKKMNNPSWAKTKETWRYRTVKSESWSPVNVVKLPSGVARDIASLAAQNFIVIKKGTKKIKKAVGPDHPIGGFDILIRYDPHEAPARMYTVQKEGKSPLTDRQKLYSIFNLDCEKVETLESATKNAERFAKTLVPREDKNDKGDKSGKFRDTSGENTDDDGEDEAEEATSVKKKKKLVEKVKPKNSAKSSDKKSTKSSGKKTGKPSGKKVLKKKKRSELDD